MTEYIEKNALYKKIAEFEEQARQKVVATPVTSPIYGACFAQLNRITAIKHMIFDAQAIEVVPMVHGEWIPNTDDFTPKCRCSICGYNKPVIAGENVKQEPENYCPNCGAKMDKGD